MESCTTPLRNSSRSKPVGPVDITVIVPTLNECENIPVLLPRIIDSLTSAGLEAEILVVDGGSTDGTPQAVNFFSDNQAVHLLETQGKGGLAGDVIQAARIAKGKHVVVMDGDLSHPAEKLPELILPLLDNRCDMTIGSRYIPGGGTPDWPKWRRLASRCGSLLALPFVDVKDPMSGFFGISGDKLIELGQQAKGFKIGLEILAQGGDHLNVQEIPIEFSDRQAGHTKFGPKQVLEYFRQLGRLSGGRASVNSAVRWGLVGLSGMGLDLGTFEILQNLGFDVLLSHSISFLAATMFNFLLNWKWAFRPADNTPSYVGYLVTCVLAYFLRAGVIAQAINIQHWAPSVALMFGIISGAIVNYVGSAWFVFRRQEGTGASSVQWRVLAIVVFAYSLMIRVLYGSLMDVIPEEAYYWNYGQHLDFGYLDHPPMVAWIVRLSTSLFGDNAFAVRLPALLCCLGTTFFTWKAARLLFNKTTALVAVSLLSCLPVFFLTGGVTTPDAFLYLCWMGCAYFVQKAVILDSGKAWYAAGLFAGLGLLSKYTMVILGLGVLLFLLTDRNSRKWLRRPEPYIAVLISLVAFSPVIYWNAQNGWVSFLFQSSRRLARQREFGLFELIGAMLLLVTPLGLIGSIKSMLTEKYGGVCVHVNNKKIAVSAKRLAAFMTFMPLAVFLLFSLNHSPKLNWTGVVFISAIPFLANDICSFNPRSNALVQWGRKAWRPMMIGLLLTFGFLGFYSISGFPGIAPVGELLAYNPSAWKNLSGSVENIRTRISKQTGSPAAITGMDKYAMSSELAFHNGIRLADGSPRVAGRGIFPDIFDGDRGLMWNSWVPCEQLADRPIIMISFGRKYLEPSWLGYYFDRMSPIQRQSVENNDKLITSFYWRVGYGYHKRQ